MNDIAITTTPEQADGKRRRWAGFAFLLSLAALGFELVTHIAAEALGDPMPDRATFAFYALVPLMLAFNESVLKPDGGRWARRVSSVWLVAVARVGTALALVAAGMVTFMLLPGLPVALYAVLFFGIGLLAWCPLIDVCVLVAQWRALGRRQAELPAVSRPLSALPAVCALAAFAFFVVRPLLIGSQLSAALSDGPRREAALARLGRLGGQEALLNLCYGQQPGYWVALAQDKSLPLLLDEEGWSRTKRNKDKQQARKAFYLLTGQGFETAPPPGVAARTGWEAWRNDAEIEETGGRVVGRLASGVSLAESQMTGTLNAAAETAQTAWTLTFQNNGDTPQEARADIRLPVGAVVTAVSLWVNGKEQQAAFGGREQTRQAYQSVAVVQRKDPLLVTQTEPGRILAQCFPVPAHGKMKIRLGLTAPLQWQNEAAPRLCWTPPTFDSVNFRLPRRRATEVTLTGATGDLDGDGWQRDTNDVVRRAYAPAELTLAAPPALRLEMGRAPQVGDRVTPELVRTQSPFPHPAEAVNVLIVTDTTAGLADLTRPDNRRTLADALAALPSGSQVRLADARDVTGKTASLWLAAADKDGQERWWRERSFSGGVDSGPALAWAWAAARAQMTVSRRPSAVVWIHDAKPAACAEASALLSLMEEAHGIGPAVVGLRVGPGPDALTDGLAGQARAFSQVADDFAPADAIRLAARAAPAPTTDAVPLGGRFPAVNGLSVASPSPVGPLAISSRVLADWYAPTRDPQRLNAAAKRAAKQQLVTPLSGAVVLETREQYTANGLKPGPETDSAANVPEPSALVGLAVGALLLGVMARRRRKSGPTARHEAAS